MSKSSRQHARLRMRRRIGEKAKRASIRPFRLPVPAPPVWFRYSWREGQRKLTRCQAALLTAGPGVSFVSVLRLVLAATPVGAGLLLHPVPTGSASRRVAASMAVKKDEVRAQEAILAAAELMTHRPAVNGERRGPWPEDFNPMLS